MISYVFTKYNLYSCKVWFRRGETRYVEPDFADLERPKFYGGIVRYGRQYFLRVWGRKQFCGRSEQIFFWFVPPLVTFWGTFIVANEVNKNRQINLLGQEGILGAVVAVPLPSYVSEVRL